MIEEELMKDNFKDNLEYLFPNQNLQTIADNLEISKSKVHNWKNGKSYPTLEDLRKIIEVSGRNLTFDRLLFTKLSDSSLTDKYIEKYSGFFYLYYYDSDSEVDKDNFKRELRSGIAFFNKNGEDLKVDALMGIKTSDLLESPPRTYKEFLVVIKEFLKATNFRGRYSGNVDLTKNEIFINLAFGEHDQAKMIFPNPDDIKEGQMYIGGLGTINSVSEGVLHNPCIGFIGLSRVLLEPSDVAGHLVFDRPKIHLRTEGERIIDLIDHLNNFEEVSMLGKEEKTTLISSNLEKIVRDWFEKHLFTYGKITTERDGNWYKMVKRSSYGRLDIIEKKERIKEKRYYDYEPRSWNQ